MPRLTRDNWRKAPWYVRYRLGPNWASNLRRFMIKITHTHATVELKDVYLGPGFHLEIPDHGSLICAPGVQFRRGFVCEIGGNGRVEIGAGTVFTSDALVQCSTLIKIGERCGFGQATFIVDGNHRFRDHTKHWLDQGDNFREIHIGDGVAVNTKCTVINDIGDHAVIGANSVVSRPVPAYCVAVGAPARVVEYFGPPELKPEGLEV